MKKNFLFNLLLSISNIVFPIISFPYAARVLGPEGIGKVQFIFSYAQYFALFAALGIPIYGVKEIAKQQQDPNKTKSIFLSLSLIFFIASTFATLIYVLSVLYIPYFSEYRTMYLIAGVLVLLSFTYTDWYYAGKADFKTIALRSIIVKAVALILLYLWVKTPNDLYQYLIILIFTILGNQVYSFFVIYSKHHQHSFEFELRRHIKPLLYIFGATAASSIYTIWDTLLLGFLANPTAVGFYTASIKFIKLLLPFVTSVGTVFIPILSHKFAEHKTEDIKKILVHSFYFLVLLTVPMAFGTYLLAPEIMNIFSGAAFAKSILPMQIMSVLPLLVGFGHFFAFQILIPAEKNKQVFIAMAAGLLISAIFNFWLAPLYQEKGAAIAIIATEISVTCIYFYYTNKDFSFKYPWSFLVQSIIASSTFIPFIIGLKSITDNILLIAIIGVLGCSILYILMHLYVFKNKFLLSYLRMKQIVADVSKA